MKDLENKDFIFSLKCVSRNGSVILNIIILSGKNHFEKFFLYNNLDRKVAMAVNNTGYNNNELSFYWFEHFDKHTCKKKEKSVENTYDIWHIQSYL